MLTAKFINSVRPKDGGTPYARYKVSGPSSEIDAYIASKKNVVYDVDGTSPIIYGDIPFNTEATYKIKFWQEQNKYFIDFSFITDAAGAIETAEKRGNARLADQIASRQADKLMGSTITSSASSALQAVVAEQPEPAQLEQPITTRGRNK